jgi:hypothetical protein
MTAPRFDRIGHGYAQTRKEEPRFRELIAKALGDVRTVVASRASRRFQSRAIVAIGC